mmetsp:Transcript_9684/g.20825  ORF Transcript_9684/g.20825 Transcript_9684/m.20825 type:complete len:104 (+) Transcript_9684:604-915(+)
MEALLLSTTPVHKVYLFTFPPVPRVRNISPFSLKVESFLRLYDIPYEIEGTDAVHSPRSIRSTGWRFQIPTSLSTSVRQLYYVKSLHHCCQHDKSCCSLGASA